MSTLEVAVMSEPRVFPRARRVNRDVLAIGEALMDVVEIKGASRQAVPGGSPANVALGLGRLGRSVTLLTSIGVDNYGEIIRTHLEASGVEVLASPPPSAQTSTARAVLQPDGSPRYAFDVRWDVDCRLLGPVAPKVVHTGSIGSYIMPGAAAVLTEVVHRAGQSLITFDPNVRPGLIANRVQVRQSIESLIAVADVVKASDEDIAWLYPGADPSEVVAEWARSGRLLAFVTMGAAGAFAATGSGHVLRVAAPSVDVVDTVGAGDSFMASVIDSLLSLTEGTPAGSSLRLDAWTLERVMNAAAAAAAYTVGRRGADLPYRRRKIGPIS